MLVAITAPTQALPPPAGGFSHGAAGTARNGFGGSIAPSPTIASWPGTGAAENGGPFAFVGAHYGSLWGVPAGPNNSMGVGYCVMEDVDGEGTVAAQADPAMWDADEMARAGALMATFGGDRVVPYGIDDTGSYNATTGEWEHPSLFGGGEYTRRRQVAVNFGVRMFLEDQSPTGVAAGRKLARDTAVVDGSGGEFSALSNGYRVAQVLADTADVQHAVGGLSLRMVWATPDGSPPTAPGTYHLEVHATDSTGHHVGYVPILQLSTVGIGDNRSVNTVARVDNTGDTPADLARWNAATATGWPVWQMNALLTTDPRFEVRTNPAAADVADRDGVAHFVVEITDPTWELAFHAQAPTDDVRLYSGTGVQGQVTWNATPQSASIHQGYAPPPPPPAPSPPPPPATGRFVVRKVLDDPIVQGDRDMSGFTFEVVAEGTETIGPTRLGTFTTDASGRTPAIDAGTAIYRISETGRPPWADGTIDPGPITVPFDPVTAGAPVVEFSYTNRVPVATIDTEATDVADDDHVVELDGKADSTFTIVDRVSYCGLVPGTGYSLVGVLRPNAVDASAVDGTTTFVPDAPCGTESVTFDVRGDSGLRGQIAVVTETLTLASTGRVIAQHDDPLDVDQTIHFLPTATVVVTAPPITPPATPPATTGTTEPATTIAASTTSTTPVESASAPTPRRRSSDRLRAARSRAPVAVTAHAGPSPSVRGCSSWAPRCSR